MHHGQTGGKRKTRKACKKHVLPNQGESPKVEANNNFPEIGGNLLFSENMEGNSKYQSQRH